jgi:hypothetical protein
LFLSTFLLPATDSFTEAFGGTLIAIFRSAYLQHLQLFQLRECALL